MSSSSSAIPFVRTTNDRGWVIGLPVGNFITFRTPIVRFSTDELQCVFEILRGISLSTAIGISNCHGLSALLRM
jgi:hypothetical protein